MSSLRKRGRPKTTGIFSTREALLSRVWELVAEGLNDEMISCVCIVSRRTVSNIRNNKEGIPDGYNNDRH